MGDAAGMEDEGWYRDGTGMGDGRRGMLQG